MKSLESQKFLENVIKSLKKLFDGRQKKEKGKRVLQMGVFFLFAKIRERERERERERQTDRQTDKQRQREKDKDRQPLLR